MTIPINLIIQEMKRKARLKLQDKVETRQSTRLPKGIIATLDLRKDKKGEYWVLILSWGGKKVSDTDMLIYQNKFFPGQEQKEIKRWGVGFFLAWVASIVASIIYITGGIFMLDFPTVWSAFGVLNISIFLGVVTVICVVVILE